MSKIIFIYPLMLWVFENDLLLEITIDLTENGIAAKMNYDTEIIRSGRKTISVEITRELRVINNRLSSEKILLDKFAS